MFESLVATLLNRFLGAYIENFDPKQLNIGIWSGDVKLRNLRLKTDALDQFKLPIDVKFGHLGELTLQIPWSNLKGQPVKIAIEDVYLLASPIIQFDEDDQERREQNAKREKLRQLTDMESAALQNADISAQLESNESFTESLVTKIIDNLQVTIKNVHIRYEDASTLTDSPYCVGVLLKELSAVSTDESWVPSFISITQKLSRKLLNLNNLSCYMNTNSEPLSFDDSDGLLAQLKNWFTESSEIQYILKPVTGNGKLLLNKAGATDTTPHIKLEVFFEEFGLVLDSQQYRDILWTLSNFHWYLKTHKFRKFRPEVAAQEDPKQWFKYAATAILAEIHDKNYRWTWESFAKRRDQRHAYISLHKQRLLGTLTDESELDKLEDELQFEDIKFYRSLTRNELRKENALSKAIAAQRNPQANTNTGWFSGWWGGDKKTQDTLNEKEHLDEEDMSLTEDQRKALYDTIDYNQDDITKAIDLPRETIKMEILATLQKGGVCIRPSKDADNLAEVVFEGCKTQFYQRPDSFLANFQIHEFRVEDGTKETLYRHIISVKQPQETSSDPFFRISFEQNPLDNSADSKLLGKLKSMTIFYNPKFIEEVARFFKPPKIHLDTVGAIMNAAESTVEGLTARTRMGLQYALEEHKTINVKLDLQAPLIILPQHPNDWKSPVAIIDAGHISVISKLVEKSKIEEIKSKPNYSDEDWKQLNQLMYDTFDVHLQEAQFLVGPNIRDTMEQLHFENSEDRHSLILDKLNIKLALGISILPDAYNLARFRIGAHVSNVALNMNDFQYKAMMQIIDAAIPAFDESDSEESSVFNTFGYKDPEIEDLSTSSAEISVLKKPAQMSDAALNQHIFEFNFDVDAVKISLSRCIDGATLKAEPFIDLVGDSLKLNFFKTVNDMHLDMILQDINLIDHIEKSGIAEFERLISSNNFVEGDVNRSKELFKLDYWRRQRIVDFNNKEIEVFDQDIKLDIATVKFVLTRKSILSILNFVLNTFTDPNAEATPADELKHNEVDDESSPQKINVNINLDSIIVVLNEHSAKLATLKLSSASISVLVLPESMDVNGNVGALTLHDDINEGTSRDSILRSLISVEGDNLIEFTYKTFDKETSTELHDSLIVLKTGSLAINFVESSFGRIFDYLAQFQRMKAIYDSARDAAIDQANQIDYPSKMKFDLSIKAPTIVFPRVVNHSNVKYDKMTIQLGELYASNKFINDKNVISAGLRNTNMSSEFNFVNEATQKAEIVDSFDISFDIDYIEEYIEAVPSMLISGKLSETNLKLTELQVKYLIGIADAVSNVFDTSDIDLEDIEEDAANANAAVKHNQQIIHERQDDHQEAITSSSNDINKANKLQASIPADHEKINFKFDVPKLALTIFNRTEGIEDTSNNELSSFSLNDIQIGFKVKEDGQFSSDISIQSFVVEDVRRQSCSHYTELIPRNTSSKAQFMLTALSADVSGKKNITFMLEVDNPQMILSLEFLFELQYFVGKALAKSTKIADVEFEDENDESSDAESVQKYQPDTQKQGEASAISVGFSVNVKRPSVVLLADPTQKNTEAIVFKIEQVLITSQNILSIAANQIGLFLCTMNDLNNQKLRIIDDFSLSFAHDSRGSDDTKFLTNIQASVDPILMRLSLRDIKLALSIFNRATELFNKSQDSHETNDEEEYKFSEDFKRRLSQYAPSIVSSYTARKRSEIQSTAQKEVIIKGEELNIGIGGMRFVLIGDVHELPVLDLNVNSFDVRAINWSNDLSAETHIQSYVNIYNYARSSWEPMVEPWPIAIYATRGNDATGISIDVVSRQMAELTISSRSIALLSQMFSLIADDIELKSREEDNPYRIVNETGYDIEVWTDESNDQKKNKKIIKQNETVPWAFEDWREIRENLDTNNRRGVLGVRLLGSDYDEITGISATGEGENIIMLTPPVEGVHSRIVSDISLGTDNVKNIWLRSTVKVQNNADVAIMVQVFSDSNAEEPVGDLVIDPGKSKALPIDHVYYGSVKFKPYIETGYNWSEECLFWKDLLYGGCPLSCNASDKNDKSIYYFQAEASYDKDEPLSRIYPHLKIVISAPLVIYNLLPFDFNYRLYDKASKKDWSGTITKGVESYIHVASLNSLLLLSVEPLGCGYGKSEFAIINSPSQAGFKKETNMNLKHEDGNVLKLQIYYLRKAKDASSLRIGIYSPYIILNRTGQNIMVDDRGNKLQSDGRSAFGKVIPRMFSFEKEGERRNRALLKVGDSQWSTPISFDAIGQALEVRTKSQGRATEMSVGVSIADGEGIYNLTKVVTIAPRYITKSTLDEPLQIVESGSTNVFTIEPNELVPLYGLRRLDSKSLMVKFVHDARGWSSPFSINDIGQIFLKVYKEGFGQVLLKVNILLENATIFIQIENANNNWPFSIRNFSDAEFFIYQSDPNVNENGEVVKTETEYKPIYYRVPPKSVMPYAYDYPNAFMKELIIRSHGRERPVNLSEIGNLKPFRLPPIGDEEQQLIIDLNVVADGPTQSLIISNYDPSLSMYKLSKSKTGSSTNTTAKFEAIERDGNFHTRIITRFEGFGISLINERNQELLYGTVRGLEIRYNDSDLYQNLSVKLKWIQIDNQLYGGIFPIVLYPSVIPKSGKEMNNHPAFSGSVCKVKDDSHGVLFIKYFTVLLQEMTIEIDEDFLFALLDFSKIPGASWNQKVQDKLCDDVLELPEPKTLSESSDIYFEALHIQPTMSHLSFMRTERVNAEDRAANSQNTLMFFFNVLTMAIGNINDAPIKLNALFMENVRVPMPLLIESIQTHYGQSFFYQVHKILGSADVLGNPVGLFNNLSSGFMDIFYEPYQGFIINDRPQEIGIGFAKGGLSFLKKSIFGFSDSMAKFTGSLAKGLSVVTLDEKFQERRRFNQRRNKPKHALYGFASGANSFFDSVSSGVTGIATAPIEGASSAGAAGFFRGIGKGVIGLPTKTAIGFFDLASNVSEGIRNTTTVFDADGLDKVRLPRHISYDQVIRPYSAREAQGQFWLKTIDGGIYFDETYLAHLVLASEERCVIVTFKKIILFEINTLTAKWVISFEDVKSVSIESTGITIGLKKKNGPFIPIPEKATRAFLYNRIGVAVEDYNQHCQVIL